jgi:LAO/AO transport system kinase
VKTIAHQRECLADLSTAITAVLQQLPSNDRKYWLLAEKAWHLIQMHRMQGISKSMLKKEMTEAAASGELNLYSFVKRFY